MSCLSGAQNARPETATNRQKYICLRRGSVQILNSGFNAFFLQRLSTTDYVIVVSSRRHTYSAGQLHCSHQQIPSYEPFSLFPGMTRTKSTMYWSFRNRDCI